MASAETEEDQEPEGGEVQAAAPAAPASISGATKAVTAADFVSLDNDRPQADENVNTAPGPGSDAGAAPQSPGGQKGRPRTSDTPNARRMREKYARQRAERVPPPDFSHLPGGSKPPAPAGQTPSPGQPAPAAAPSPSGPLSDEQYRANAEATVTVLTGLLAMGLSKAWKVDQEEKEALTRDLAAVAKKYNWSAFSVEIALVMTTGMYIMSRAEDPETRRKLGKIFGKIKGKKSDIDVQSSVVKPDAPASAEDIEVD